MRKPHVLVAFSAAVLAMVSSCGDAGESGDSAPKPSDLSASEPSATVTTPPPPAPTPPPDSDADGVPDSTDQYPKNPYASTVQEFRVVCDQKGPKLVFTIDRVKPDFTSVWATPMSGDVYCEMNGLGDGTTFAPVSEAEQVIYDSDKKPSRYTLTIPYEQCVEHGTQWTTSDWPVSRQQIPEAEAALILCPNHPDAAAIRSHIADIGALEGEIRNGTAFDDGNFRVGSQIQPGLYFTENVADCYWERLDSAGEIIDNNFISDALRAEVTIAASDFSFHTEGCGTWRQVK